jgi:hypothetical protein
MRWHDDVAVQDRCIDSVASNRLKSDLSGKVGFLDGVENASVTANGAVLGQTATGLPHEPHGRVHTFLANGGGKE